MTRSPDYDEGYRRAIEDAAKTTVRALAHRKKAETDGAARIAYDIMAVEYLDEVLAAIATLTQQPRPDPNDAAANRYHQTLGAKWMVEAIIREYRTRFRLNGNAQAFANDLERRWEDEAFWRPIDPPPRPETAACKCEFGRRLDCDIHGSAAKPAACARCGGNARYLYDGLCTECKGGA